MADRPVKGGDPRGALPSVHRLIGAPGVARFPHAARKAVVRALLAEVRADPQRWPQDWERAVEARLVKEENRATRRVLNLTGVVLHTNLGRAPLAPAVVQAVQELGGGYSNVELDLETGERGGRGDMIQGLLADLVGAEASLVVNNNAAAVLLCLSTLAAGREVIVSRGELVEIGGSFRIPEVISAGGARLVEVGTTNRTRVADYAAAINPATAVILRVHPSNFRITGFTERPERAALAELARSHGLVLVDDLGSGRIDPEGQRGEEDLARALHEGADLVCASGDKLLGGPQAGLVLGRKSLVACLRKAPLYRALRVGKLVATALERTLALIRSGEGTAVSRMLALRPDELELRANQLLPSLRGLAWPPGTTLRPLAITGETGGGSLPEQPLASYGLEIRGLSVETLTRALRAQNPAVIGRIHQGGLLLDLRTLLPGEEELLRGALCAALAGWPALG